MREIRSPLSGFRSPFGSRGAGPSFDFFVDSVNGSDSNNGLTAETAFATMSRLDTELAADPSISVGFARGSRLAPLTLGFDRNVSGKWGAYGEGDMPFIDCSLPVTAGSITAHGTHSNVYVVEITHAVAPFYTNNVASNGPHVGLWWETAATGLLGQYLEPVFGSANTAAAELFVKNNPGRCFVQKVGSSLTDVRTETTGSTLRYTFQLADSSDPRSGGSLRYACYHATGLRIRSGAVIDGILFGRNTRKDCVSCINDGTESAMALPKFKNSAIIDPGCHAVVGPSDWEQKVIAYSRTPGSLSGGGGAWHNFASAYDSRVPTIFDSYIRGFGHAVYSHGSAQPIVLGGLSGARLRIEMCNNGFSLPVLDTPAVFEDVEARLCNGLITGSATGQNTVRRFVFEGRLVSNECNIIQYEGATLEDGALTIASGTFRILNTFLAFNNFAAADALPATTLKRLTIRGLTQWEKQATLHPYLAAVVEDSVIGSMVFTTNKDDVRFLTKATIENSYFGPNTNGGVPLFANLAEYQARVPGVANDVVMFNNNLPPTFAGDMLVNPTLTGPAAILGKGMGVDPAIIAALPTKLANVPTLVSMGLVP